MKRKLFTALVVAGGLFLTSCQEDSTMEELIQETELNESMNASSEGNSGAGGSGDSGNGSGIGNQ